jgi:hypothetical protein
MVHTVPVHASGPRGHKGASMHPGKSDNCNK